VAPSPASHRAEGIRNVHSGGCDAGGGVEKEEKRKKNFIIFFFSFQFL
jgi:predicted nucleic acid-binding Zn ribbon protein